MRVSLVSLLVWSGMAGFHDGVFLRLQKIVPPNSPSHLWFLKQLDRFILNLSIRPERPLESVISSLERFGAMVLTGSEIGANRIAGILESSISFLDGRTDVEILALANTLWRSAGIDLLGIFDGLFDSIERQAALARITRARLIESVADCATLTEKSPEELECFLFHFEPIRQHAIDVLMTTDGIDIAHTLPALVGMGNTLLHTPGESAERTARYQTHFVECPAERLSATEWAELLNHPEYIKLSLSNPHRAAWFTNNLISRISECIHDTNEDLGIVCESRGLMQQALRIFVERAPGLSPEDHSAARSLMESLMEWPERSQGEHALKIIPILNSMDFRPTKALTDDRLVHFPRHSPPLMLLWSRLKTIAAVFAPVDGESITDLANAVIDSIVQSVDHLEEFQVEWLAEYLELMPRMNPHLGSLMRRDTPLSTAVHMAFDMSRMCGIRVFDFFVVRSLSEADVKHIRSVISNFVVSGVHHNGFDILMAELLDPNTTSAQRERIALAWKISTIARKEFELRPIAPRPDSVIADGREAAITGFILHGGYAVTCIDKFVDFVLGNQVALVASKKLRFQVRLPAHIHNHITREASPLERFQTWSARITQVYRENLGEALNRLSNSDGRVLRQLQFIPGILFAVELRLGILNSPDYSQERKIIEKLAGLMCRVVEVLPSAKEEIVTDLVRLLTSAFASLESAACGACSDVDYGAMIQIAAHLCQIIDSLETE